MHLAFELCNGCYFRWKKS